MKFKHKYLIYISIPFLLIGLYRADYLEAPQISSPLSFTASIVFLFVGFIIYAICWKHILERLNYRVALRECFAGTGLSIFGKYVPGKVWTIVGRAAYLAERTDYPLAELTAISLNAQFLTLWVGLVLGVIGLFLLGGFHLWGWLALLLWLLLTGLTFSRAVHAAAEYAMNKILRRDVTIPHLDLKSALSILPWFVLYWMALSIAFYMFIIGLIGDVPLSIGLGFPLAGTLGVMAVITPGGLGVREGVLVGYLTLAGISLGEATTISVSARVWFLLGEVFIFIVGTVAARWKGSQ